MVSPDENGHVTSALRRGPERDAMGDEDEFALDPVQLDLVEEIHAELLENVDLEASADLSVEESRPGVDRVARALTNQRARLLPAVVREEIVARVIDEVLGLGPIERMVQDSSISEIMVNDINEVYYAPCPRKKSSLPRHWGSGTSRRNRGWGGFHRTRLPAGFGARSLEYAPTPTTRATRSAPGSTAPRASACAAPSTCSSSRIACPSCSA